MCFISKYVLNGEHITDTLMGRVLDGIVDSHKSVISSPDILSGGSSSHTFLKSFTKA